MRVEAYAGLEAIGEWLPARAPFLAVALLLWAVAPVLAFDANSAPGTPVKIPAKGFSSAAQALSAGVADLAAGDAASSVEALTYAAEGGEPIARWKLGEMYADGVGVQRDDLKAYHYFDQLVEDYDEDAPDQKNRGAISDAFVAVGVYSLSGIPGSEVKADAERARLLFQYAATTFGNPDAEYDLAHMYLVGSGGLAKDNISAARWLGLAAQKGHRPSQALLGHLLFTGDGVPQQRARGLMWLQTAQTGAQSPKDDWILSVCQRDLAQAADTDRQMAAAMLDERAKGPPLPSFISRSVIKTLQFLSPFNIAGSSQPKAGD
jgi:TPR repeat protein